MKCGLLFTAHCVAVTACCFSVDLPAQPVPDVTVQPRNEVLEQLNGIEFRPAISIDSAINARVGELIREARIPSAPDAKPQEMNCNMTCSAFEPGNAVLELTWSQDSIMEVSRSAGGASASPDLRLDVSGTVRGFREQNYGTVRLREIPLQAGAATSTAPVGAAAASVGQPDPALLRRVEAGKIVARDANLPVFRSIRDVERAVQLPGLPQAAVNAVRKDQLTGSLGQVRILSRALESPPAGSIQKVTIEGLQPALSYRFRLVEERGGDALELAEQVCHVRVCPVDYYD